jgi:uncharacterized protein (TIGR02001 family)
MARGSFLAGMLKSGILSAALVVGLALTAYADDAKLTLSGAATITTDYIFRSYSLTSQNPAVQPEFDLTYGIYYAYIWGSNTSVGEGIEIDYGAGITPKWVGIDFNIAGLAYTYPGADNEVDYFELRTSVAHTFDKLTLSVGNWWSPDYAQLGFQEDAIELGAGYAFAGKLWNFFTPTISGTVGWQTFEETIPEYTYWNVGLTLGFLDHWSADIRYYDTDYSQGDCLILIGQSHSCDARAVGTIKATF